jgi:hypothetical protein
MRSLLFAVLLLFLAFALAFPVRSPGQRAISFEDPFGEEFTYEIVDEQFIKITYTDGHRMLFGKHATLEALEYFDASTSDLMGYGTGPTVTLINAGSKHRFACKDAATAKKFMDFLIKTATGK